MERQFLSLGTLLEIPHVPSYYWFDLSPDGAQAAFSYNPSGQWEINLVPLAGSARPRQVTGGVGGKFAPRWSPDGR
ncbi:MAG: hypothetical protein MUP62_03165, partial [Dehalococcoidia bacterium]|nr:hypothetical protein [Dehalococcoidia bacterium]